MTSFVTWGLRSCSDEAYPRVADWDETMCAIEMRVHSRAGVELEELSILRDHPDAGKRSVQVFHDSFGAGLKNASQRVVRRQRQIHVRPNGHQPVSRALTILQVAIEPRILEGYRCLRCEHLQDRDPVRREYARRQVVFKIENAREVRLVDQRQTQNGPDAMVKDVGIRRKGVLCRGIIENHVVSSSHHVANDGLRQHGRVGGGIPLVHRDGIAAGGCLRLNQELIALWADEKTAFSAGVLDRRAHETVDERFQHHLARDRLRRLSSPWRDPGVR